MKARNERLCSDAPEAISHLWACPSFGPLQKFNFTCAASEAFTRTCTRPAASTRGNSAPQTFVLRGMKLSRSLSGAGTRDQHESPGKSFHDHSCRVLTIETRATRLMSAPRVVKKRSPSHPIPVEDNNGFVITTYIFGQLVAIVKLDDVGGLRALFGAHPGWYLAHAQRSGGDHARGRSEVRLRIHGLIAREIGLAIVSGRLRPGHVLDGEVEASSRRRVSHTAYREALRILSAKGLIQSRPRTGTRVSRIEDWHLLDPDVLAWLFSGTPSPRGAARLVRIAHHRRTGRGRPRGRSPRREPPAADEARPRRDGIAHPASA